MGSSQRNILIVDDIPLMRQMLMRHVKAVGLRILKENPDISGFDVIEAKNGRDALDSLMNQRIDVIFLDLMMPVMDGIEFLTHKAAEADLKDIPVIVCSAINERKTISKAENLGASWFVMKPFAFNSIEEIFHEALTIAEQAIVDQDDEDEDADEPQAESEQPDSNSVEGEDETPPAPPSSP